VNTEATLNNWTTIFLVIAAQGILLCLLFVFHKSWKLKKNKILASLILSFSLMLLYYVAFWTKFLPQLPFQIHLLGELTYLIAPLAFLYINEVNNIKSKGPNYLHFVPFGMVSMLLLTQVYRVGSVLQILYFIVYTYLIWNVLDTKSPSYKWAKQVAISYSVVAGGFFLYYLLVWNGWLTPEFDYWISVTMSFFIYFIGYKAILKSELLEDNKPISKYEKSLLSEDAATSISEKIIEHIESLELYKKGEYKLKDLADELSIPTHTISQVLNNKMNKSFSELMNSYRIHEAKKLLQEKENLSIISIAYSVGFNNKVSFNNSFKKHTGYTPSEYRNNGQEINVSLN